MTERQLVTTEPQDTNNNAPTEKKETQINVIHYPTHHYCQLTKTSSMLCYDPLTIQYIVCFENAFTYSEHLS